MKRETGRKIITFDWAIKTVLRDKANFDVLEGFLTALFKRPIVILDLLESESNRRDDTDKYNHVDLLAKTCDGERIIIEVQYLTEMAYLRRLAYGTAKTIVETLGLGEPYSNLEKVYSISLLYFDATEDGDDYIYHGKTEFTGLHTHHAVTLKKSLVGDQVRIGETNVFPEYYLIPLKRFTDVVRDDLDQWVYAFKNNEVLDEFTAPGIGALKEKLDYLKMNEGERRRFEAHMNRIRSEWGMVEGARQEGLEEGREEGRREGREEERQRHEKERKILIRSLYENGVAIEVIAVSVGLSEPAIRRLLNDG
ncbi:Rpn family recombination-promoting nuclease/putative transposase [Candidatus Thiosymbion oneisti]|uniref:Rpn family recombination-promoting nuclease/putative transposase n=1 Tax=Candidatus Thiosymbion oneisti TaxID=589554 RepID=UPI0013FD2C51|nr:Rpn family recombination-promoting nuclease/putative transposase [Candidatus Thiosymbion oneisti]